MREEGSPLYAKQKEFEPSPVQKAKKAKQNDLALSKGKYIKIITYIIRI